MNVTVEPAAKNSRVRGLWRAIAFLAALIVLLVLVRLFGVGERLTELREWIGSLGAWGPAVYILLYIVAVVAAIPGSALTVGAGALFGSVVGVMVVSIGSTLGASCCFLLARYFARDSVARWLSNSDKFRKLDHLTEEHGAIIVALTRLVPLMPFNLLNYGFGLTRVPFWTFVFWSWLCMLPGTALYVIGADAFSQGIAQGKIPWILVAATVGAGVGLAILVRYAARKLKDKRAKAGLENA